MTEREKTAIELLLSEPEIVAWLESHESGGRRRAAEAETLEDALERRESGE